jgi:hypothetical protein
LNEFVEQWISFEDIVDERRTIVIVGRRQYLIKGSGFRSISH